MTSHELSPPRCGSFEANQGQLALPARHVRTVTGLRPPAHQFATAGSIFPTLGKLGIVQESGPAIPDFRSIHRAELLPWRIASPHPYTQISRSGSEHPQSGNVPGKTFNPRYP